MPAINLVGIPIVLLSKIGDVIIDPVDSVTINHETLVTKNPTEIGVNITDHQVNLPVTIQMSGRFVDAPFASGGAAIGFSALAGVNAGLNSGLLAGLAFENWQLMETLNRSNIPFEVFIQQGTYLNMVFSNLSAGRSKGDGTSQTFQAEMTEILEVSAFALLNFNVAANVAHTANKVQALGASLMSPL